MKYPEHEKQRAVKTRSQAIGDFLDWLTSEKEICLHKWSEYYKKYYPSCIKTEDLLAEFFDIDLKVVENEKLTMLEEIRKTNGI